MKEGFDSYKNYLSVLHNMSFLAKEDRTLATLQYGWINTHEQYDFASAFVNVSLDGHSPYLVLLNHELQVYALYNETVFENEKVAEWVRSVVRGFVEVIPISYVCKCSS
jgi:hypothetical protein